ncbi:hypothetical protein IWZ03DRAFT_433815 [Phyllosticta citriasiana]|uniref:Uncharacterized protein n=1 Tax=Phyllosticta citriasiana TaxID=595635 RepID=A0ABR1K8S2_9PEZI
MNDWFGPEKFSALFRQVNGSEILEGIPEVSKTRSFAPKCHNCTKTRPDLDRPVFDRAADFLFHVMSVAGGLKKLSVVSPQTPSLYNFGGSSAPHGLPELPFVENLVIDWVSRFLVYRCPRISSLTIAGFARNGPGVDQLQELLFFARGLSRLRHLEIDSTFYLMLRNDLAQQMPNLKSLTLVITGRLSPADPAVMVCNRQILGRVLRSKRRTYGADVTSALT